MVKFKQHPFICSTLLFASRQLLFGLMLMLMVMLMISTIDGILSYSLFFIFYSLFSIFYLLFNVNRNRNYHNCLALHFYGCGLDAVGWMVGWTAILNHDYLIPDLKQMALTVHRTYLNIMSIIKILFAFDL